MAISTGAAILGASVIGGAVAMKGSSVATAELFSRDEWAALKPSSISAYFWSGKYVGFYDTGAVQGGFIFDPDAPADKAFTKISTYATAGYNDPLRGNLYLQIGADVQKWDGGATSMTYTWRSKEFAFGKKVNLGVAKVEAEVYPVTLTVYADGALKSTRTITANTPVKLASGSKHRRWLAEVTGTNMPQVLAIVETTDDLRRLTLS